MLLIIFEITFALPLSKWQYASMYTNIGIDTFYMLQRSNNKFTIMRRGNLPARRLCLNSQVSEMNKMISLKMGVIFGTLPNMGHTLQQGLSKEYNWWPYIMQNTLYLLK